MTWLTGTATNEYRDYLTGEFSRRIPVYLSQYRTDIDLIELNLASPAVTKTNVSAQCDALQTQARGKFTLLKSTLGVNSAGAVSGSVVDTYSTQLEDGITHGKREKLDKYDEIVGMYNKTLLAGAMTPVIDKVIVLLFSRHAMLTFHLRLFPIHTQMREL